MSVLQKIIPKFLDEDQYIKEEVPKVQIYLHHTASSPDPYGVFKWWAQTPERIATAFIIGRGTGTTWKDGDIIQAFNSSHWAWHLGLKPSHLAVGGVGAKTNKYLNSRSIGIEICSWGQLTKTDKGFISYAGTIVPDVDVVELPMSYRGFRYYQAYTDAQLDSVRELVLYLGNKWKIPTAFKGPEMFNVCPKALQGEPGVWTHTSVRPDKNDCFPQPQLIEMLKSL
jgi:N-acetyl-anhydromuramyl-L-alanine amidase AmpD